jgi:hypothetical protein
MLIFRHYADHHYPPNNDHHYPPNNDHHYPPNNDHHHQLAATRHIWVFYRPHPAYSAYSQSVCW